MKEMQVDLLKSGQLKFRDTVVVKALYPRIHIPFYYIIFENSFSIFKLGCYFKPRFAHIIVI